MDDSEVPAVPYGGCPVRSAIGLCACYARSGTEPASVCTRRAESQYSHTTSIRETAGTSTESS
eukprot:3933238-Rhodomonas_salina.2